MNLAHTSDREFIQKLTELVELNLEDEKFGVDVLIQLSGLSPHIVRQRIKKISQKTISQFINEIRLRRAMEMLQQGMITASEVAYKVGFGSATYFNNCFHDFYGYPPGEVKKRGMTGIKEDHGGHDPGNLMPVSVKKRPSLKRKIVIVSFALLAVLLSALIIYYFLFNKSGRNFSSPDKEISIAVLPFTNLSDSPENRYFTDGVMEDILSNLNRISSIKVTSRTSVEKYRQTTRGATEIAKELNVRYILEGSVQRSNDKVRVRVQLIDARRDQHILSETFDRELDDIFYIQSNIAIQIANELEAALSPGETEMIGYIPTRNTEAYSLYLKGRYFWYKRTREGFEKSIEFFEKAVEADPGYALAWAGLGDGYFYLSWYNWFEPGREQGFEKAKEIALKAIRLDNDLAEAHVLLGNVYFWHEWNWQEAEKELSLAVKLNPNYYMAHWVYAELLDVLAKRVEARAHLNRALELDPVFYLPYSTSALLYYNDGNFKGAIKDCHKCIELNPDYNSAYYHAWFSYLQLDSIPQAIHFLQELLLVDYNTGYSDSKYYESVDSVFKTAGMEGLLQWMLQNRYAQSSFIGKARLLMMIGNREEAVRSLELGYKLHERDMVRIISIYDLVDLRSEPRYMEIVKNMGLADYLNVALASGQLPQ